MTLLAKAAMPWIALSIGNSRLHWYFFQGLQLNQTWDISHVTPSTLPTNWQEWQQLSPALAHCQVGSHWPEVWMISVVPSQTRLWQTYPQAKVLTAADIPFQLPYPTFGLDRALSTWAAGTLFNWPILVIDAGTALTYTGAISPEECLGGAILPGLGLQLRSLKATPELPVASMPDQLPNRWALDTETAMQSGVMYTLLSGLTDYINDWLSEHPTSKVVMTGGDAPILYRSLLALSQPSHRFGNDLVLDPLLQASGLLKLRQRQFSHQVLN